MCSFVARARSSQSNSNNVKCYYSYRFIENVSLYCFGRSFCLTPRTPALLLFLLLLLSLYLSLFLSYRTLHYTVIAFFFVRYVIFGYEVLSSVFSLFTQCCYCYCLFLFSIFYSNIFPIIAVFIYFISCLFISFFFVIRDVLSVSSRPNC